MTGRIGDTLGEALAVLLALAILGLAAVVLTIGYGIAWLVHHVRLV